MTMQDMLQGLRWPGLFAAIVLLFLVATPEFAQESGGDAPADDVVAPADDVVTPADDVVAPEPVARRAPKGTVVVGKIDGEIGLSESAYVKRLIDEAERAEATVLLIELNTFGGRVDAAVAIRDALMDTSVHTAVFINRRAISAGALISLACDSIAIASGATIGAATPVTQGAGSEVAQPVAEKYVSYFREEMRSTAETNGRNGDIAEAMVDADKELEGISAEGKLLTLNTRTALEHKIADVEAESVADALDKLGLAGKVLDVSPTWSEALVGFLTSQAVASMLFLAMMGLAYMEYQTPGFGIFGGGAVLCGLVLYFGHYMVNLAGWEEMILLVVGVALILAEIFVAPGFGLLGISGLLAVLSSFAMLLMAGDWSDFTFNNPFTIDALSQVLLTTFLAIFMFLLMMRYLPRASPSLGGRLILQTNLAAAGYQSHEETVTSLVGEIGTTKTALRPSGKATIGAKRRNVETEGEFIAAGQEVRVMHHKEGRIVVRGIVVRGA
jgi:membrane-bound serine protease (ClpP class)